MTRKSLLDRSSEPVEHPLESTLTQLSEWARQCYTDLLKTEGFVSFFRGATPIDAIEQSRIGSRPARRTGQQTLADLRAIPWVFSWGQARFFLSGWYGVGTALGQLKSVEPETFRTLGETMNNWAPSHYLLSNVATSLAATDLEIMRAYADMLEDKALRDKFMSRIETELSLTQAMIEEIYGGPLSERRPNIQRMMNLRASGLRVLHYQQIGLLKMWRSYHRMQQPKAAEDLIPQLLLTVNAIASGLGTTAEPRTRLFFSLSSEFTWGPHLCFFEYDAEVLVCMNPQRSAMVASDRSVSFSSSSARDSFTQQDRIVR